MKINHLTLKNLVLSTALSLSLGLSFTLSAHAEGSVLLSSTAEVDVVIKNKDGVKETKRVPAKKVVPDGEVIYTTTFKNVIAKPVGSIVINNPIPKNMRYTAGSAAGANTDITFSADGGKTFNTEDKVMITTDEGKTRPAGADDLTNIRWAYKGELAAGQAGVTVFKAVVK